MRGVSRTRERVFSLEIRPFSLFTKRTRGIHRVHGTSGTDADQLLLCLSRIFLVLIALPLQCTWHRSLHSCLAQETVPAGAAHWRLEDPLGAPLHCIATTTKDLANCLRPRRYFPQEGFACCSWTFRRRAERLWLNWPGSFSDPGIPPCTHGLRANGACRLRKRSRSEKGLPELPAASSNGSESQRPRKRLSSGEPRSP